MTKPQIWVAAFLGLFILLFALNRLVNKNESSGPQMPGMNAVPQTGMSSESSSPAELIVRLGCNNCHGADLAGTNMAPALKGISQNWSRDQLINYLRNPSSFMDKDRFKEYRNKYPGVIMPSFGNIDVKDLGTVADYLLKQ